MRQRKLIWQLYPSYLAVIAVTVVAVTAYCSHCLRNMHRSQARAELNHFAAMAVGDVRSILAGAGPRNLDDLCAQFGRLGDGQLRLTVIAPSGRVLADSQEEAARMENHGDREEIREALQKGSGCSIRFSSTLGVQMMYVAMPVGTGPAALDAAPGTAEGGGPVAFVRVAAPVSEIDAVLRDIYVSVLWAALLIAAGAAVLSLVIARRISRPIVAIQEIAERFAAGELRLRVPLPDSTELAGLAGALNRMASQLGERITTITEQRNELDAVLSSMVEGVFAVDNEGRIVSVNPAAAGLLGIDPLQAQARHLEEIVRNVDLQEFVRQTLAGIQPPEKDISLPINGGRSFRLHGAALADARGRRSGAVIVLNDLTRVRQLETVRRDFVANVSHELKTPVTSIQGFAEALVDGGVRDPAQIERYLGIISRHASRLNAIIDDLLTLSCLEEAGQQRALSFNRDRVKPVLEEAIDLAAVKADDRGITIDLACDDELEARINPPLLEQAVVNLIDNAVKYSPEGSHIHVVASGAPAAPERDASASAPRESAGLGPPNAKMGVWGPLSHTSAAFVSVAVIDEGSGIALEHLPRIFERFYVVDKSRSRKLGGTGLGLAIVKHIAQAHGGRVTVQSAPGRGSTFTLHLPV
jgi:two-component system phosphate regulon sensor histidine kinase PhoR